MFYLIARDRYVHIRYKDHTLYISFVDGNSKLYGWRPKRLPSTLLGSSINLLECLSSKFSEDVMETLKHELDFFNVML